MKNRQSRKWIIVINEPKVKGYTHDKIENLLKSFKSLKYWCMADELGKNKTYHTHIYVMFTGGVRFSTLKAKFPEAHINVAEATAAINRDYIRKLGRWQNSNKHNTHIPGTFKEWGEIPKEQQGKRNDFYELYNMIKSGASDYEIIEQNPSNMKHLDKIGKARQTINAEQYKTTFRELEVIYIYGETGTGKTSFVVNKHGYENIYRVTNYKHPFDDYNGEDVIVFEEFNNQLKIHDMLNYLDGHPLKLPCRYMDKQACYTKVYIISNWKLNKQYYNIQKEYPETWRAFLRRINKVVEFSLDYAAASADTSF